MLYLFKADSNPQSKKDLRDEGFFPKYKHFSMIHFKSKSRYRSLYTAFLIEEYEYLEQSAIRNLIVYI